MRRSVGYRSPGEGSARSEVKLSRVGLGSWSVVPCREVATWARNLCINSGKYEYKYSMYEPVAVTTSGRVKEATLIKL